MPAKTEQRLRVLCAGLFLALAGCEQLENDLIQGVAGFENPQDLTVVDGYLYVISGADDELNVLDTRTSPYDWLKAPNPLQPLAIPVQVISPRRVISDVRFERVDGQDEEKRGPYVYVYNPGVPRISVIGTDAEALHPALRLLEVTTLTVEGPISAVVARGPSATEPVSTVYYAIASTAGSQVLKVTLPTVGPDAAAPLEALAPSAPEVVLDLPGEGVSSLALVPDTAGENDFLAVATRTSLGDSGRTFLTNLATGAQRTMNFPAPVRMLVTSPGSPGGGDAGLVLFGLLDEASCGGADACRGILAVLVATGEVMDEAGRGRMFPIRHGAANAVTFSLIRDVDLATFADGTFTLAAEKFPILGVVAYATGRLGFFDAEKLRNIDGNPAVPQLVVQEYRDAEGVFLGDPCNPADTASPCLGIFESGARFSEGATASEDISARFQDVLPGLTDRTLDPTQAVPSRFPVDPALLAPCGPTPTGAAHPNPAQCPRVRVGDRVQLAGTCSAELAVIAVGADFFDTAAPPPGCDSATGYTVRAGSDRPFVLVGSVDGYLGRAAPGATFRHFRPHFFRPPGATYTPDEPALSLVINPHPDIEPGAGYLFRINGGVEPQFVILPRVKYSRGLRFTYPGGLGFIRETVGQVATDIDSLMVSLPADREILEVQLTGITPNVENFSSVNIYQ